MAHPTSNHAHPQGFASTRWSLVLAAGRGDAPESKSALAELCEVYWYPLYAYVRRSGHPADEARDLTQEFFARLLEKRYLQTADAERGRFRAFLLTAFRRFLIKERHRARALKRGGVRRREAWLLIPLASATYIACVSTAGGLPDTFRASTSVLAAGAGLWASWRFLRGEWVEDLAGPPGRWREPWPLIPLFGAGGLIMWIYYPWNPRMVAITAVLTAGIGLWIVSKISRGTPPEIGHSKPPEAGRGLDTF